MRLSALEFLACPTCRAALRLEQASPTEADGHVMNGTLVCAGHGCRFELKAGVPILRTGDVEAIKTETAERFAEEWTRWTDMRDYYEQQFLGWLAPLTRSDFEGKVVFEGGAGKGRHSALLGRFGVKAAIALDLGRSAYVAFGHCRALENVHVVIGDLTNPPVKRVFDLAFSVGVLHHLPDPAVGFQALAGVVKPGGQVAFWVYGLENNEWITRVVDPVRKSLTSRMSSEVLKLASLAPSAALWGCIQTIYRADSVAKLLRLPYRQYFGAMKSFPLDEIHSIVFDQLVTPVAHYLPGHEVKRWLAEGFDQVQVRWHGEYSWTGLGTVARTQARS